MDTCCDVLMLMSWPSGIRLARRRFLARLTKLQSYSPWWWPCTSINTVLGEAGGGRAGRVDAHRAGACPGLQLHPKAGGGPERSGGAVTRQYLEVNLAFYLTAAVTILFLHNWLSLLALGGDSLDGNHQAWIIWAFVDVMLPLTLGTTGCRLLCGESGS